MLISCCAFKLYKRLKSNNKDRSQSPLTLAKRPRYANNKITFNRKHSAVSGQWSVVSGQPMANGHSSSVPVAHKLIADS
ncbi:MAG: hypothetical protein F6J90_42135 [Moorea sp. SIOASIH]|uniref:hypothetical protein n=1 Tax=Moorena sp. SIOASIH TaxID=2607817 RepID=UPI0013B77F2C|nr:hypothetical protein [Moorena sp. SIOASIH]NEO42569.1 hypothetical protein [Moorena sp. SIOASIH]